MYCIVYILYNVLQVLNKLNFPEHKSAKLDFYVTDTFYPRHQGCLPLDCFSLIGIPFTFKWKSADDFEAAKGDLIKRNFPWEEPLASKVAAALLLTDSEKEFLIAQQLGYLDSQQVIVNLFFQVFFIVSSFIAAHLLNYRKGSKGNQTAMGVTYLTSSLVAYLCYVVISDSYNCYLDQYADKYAATISPELSQAGCEYYNKILESNKALRVLVPGFDKKFTAYGNETTGMLRTKTLPLISRRDFIQKIHDKQLENLNKSKESQV